jgi:hypothetical protein
MDLDDLRRDQVKVVEKPFRGRRDVGALADVFGERLVGPLEDVRVVVQSRIDATGVPALRIDREVRRQGERPLIEALGAERFLTEGLIARTIFIYPGMKEQDKPLFQIDASSQPLSSVDTVQLYDSVLRKVGRGEHNIGTIRLFRLRHADGGRAARVHASC